MNGTVDRLPADYVRSFEFVHPSDIAASLIEKRQAGPITMWTMTNEVRPSDLYCYLGARFGPPNGMQNFLRNDSSDNLVHWEWYLKTSIGHVTIAGLNFRTDVWVMGAALPDSEKDHFIEQMKADFANHAKEMGHLRKEHLEPWIEFVNPYQRLRRAIKQLLDELDGLGLDPDTDTLPSMLESDDIEEAGRQW